MKFLVLELLQDFIIEAFSWNWWRQDRNSIRMLIVTACFHKLSTNSNKATAGATTVKRTDCTASATLKDLKMTFWFFEISDFKSVRSKSRLGIMWFWCFKFSTNLRFTKYSSRNKICQFMNGNSEERAPLLENFQRAMDAIHVENFHWKDSPMHQP